MADTESGSRTTVEGAEGFLDLLQANGVEYIFINPGSDLVPIVEAAAKARDSGRPCPTLVLCQHEFLAMTAAHGHFMVSGKPQAVMVHLDVGTLQVGGALHNAQRGYAAMLFCAGHAPWTAGGEARGSKAHSIDYRMEQFDQAGIVRGYVKWDYELRATSAMADTVQRAFQVATTEPCGPVYLSLPREILMEKMAPVRPLDPVRYGPAISPAGDPAALAQAARWLAAARHPVALTNILGRHRDAVAPFVKLAETLGMPVITPNLRMNFPTDHYLWAEAELQPYLEAADVILTIDIQVPWAPSQCQTAPGARIIHIDMDPIRSTMPTSNFPADLRILADSSKAVPALLSMVKQNLTAADRARVRARTEVLKEQDSTRRRAWQASARSHATRTPISADYMAWCLGQEIGPDALLVDEGIGFWTHTRRHVTRTLPGTTYHTDGCCLGWGLGSALGAKLAAPGSDVVCFAGDGSFLFGQPVAALCAARTYAAPFLTVVFDNGGYHALETVLDRAYGSQSHASRVEPRLGTAFAPPPDYAALARACGAWGANVRRPEDLRAALRSGLKRIRAGQAALVAVELVSRP